MNVLLAVLAAAAGLAAACSSEPPPAPVEATATPDAFLLSESVIGKVSFPAAPAIPPGASLVVQLRDVTLIDASSVLIAEQAIADPGPSPVGFAVRYHPNAIDSRNTYGLLAKITDADGQLLFINDTAYDVITRGHPSRVDMELVAVGQ